MDDGHHTDPKYRPLESSIAQVDVNEILRQKRKTRGKRACYPCRQRKVKCDHRTPCQTCTDRHHTELCTYEPPSKQIDLEASHRTTSSHDPIEHSPTDCDKILGKLERLEQSIQELQQEVKTLAAAPADQLSYGAPLPVTFSARGSNVAGDVEDEDVYTRNKFTGEAMHLGPHSVLATATALRKDNEEATLQDFSVNSTLPLFGLDNQSATYPFIDLGVIAHGSLPRIQELCKLLPPDTDCLQCFRQYRDIAHVLYPGVVDIVKFEADLTVFLIRRADSVQDVGSEQISEQSVYGTSLHWIGLLFATLASGCQWSAVPGNDRQFTSQVYVCCAYDCLRITNCLSNTTLVDIQTLLILGNVISNSMNAGVAWSFLGLTIRLAKSLGLHRPCPPSTQIAEQSLREEVWWRVVWQDSLLSIPFDRASSTSTIKHHRAVQTFSNQRKLYTDCMKILCQVALDIVRERSNKQSQQKMLNCIARHRRELDTMMEQASDPLRDIHACKSMRDQLEHWNLYLHKSYVTSELYRPFLRKYNTSSDPDLTENRRTCVDNLTNTVDAFLGLENSILFAHQSWAAVHRALSSGLLLGIMKEHLRSERVRTLLERLIVAMSSLESGPEVSEMAAPITRSVTALSSLISFDRGPRIGASGNSPQRQWGLGDSQLSPVADESLLFTASNPNSMNENSLYSLVNRILWGPQEIRSAE